MAIAWHGRAEIASVLLRKRREGADAPEDLASLAQQFHDDCQQQLIRFLPLTEAVMTRLEAVLATAPATTNFRAADPLHLACAAEHGFNEVHSNDRLFLNAAPLFGMKGECDSSNLIDSSTRKWTTPSRSDPWRKRNRRWQLGSRRDGERIGWVGERIPE